MAEKIKTVIFYSQVFRSKRTNHLPKNFRKLPKCLLSSKKETRVVSAISTAKDIYGTIYIIVDYRVGIFPFSVNKCDVTDTLLPHGATEVSFQPAQSSLNDRSAEHMILES